MAAISLRTGELLDVDAASMAGNHVPEDPEAVYELEFANGVMATSAHTGSGAVYEFEIIGSEGTIRCWHQLGSDCVGSGSVGVCMRRRP